MVVMEIVVVAGMVVEEGDEQRLKVEIEAE